jgi:hypothetical protein
MTAAHLALDGDAYRNSPIAIIPPVLAGLSSPGMAINVYANPAVGNT